jgi:hypothetical protein
MGLSASPAHETPIHNEDYPKGHFQYCIGAQMVLYVQKYLGKGKDDSQLAMAKLDAHIYF